MPDTSRGSFSSESGAELVESKKRPKKKKRHSGVYEKSPFPVSEPCGKGVLVECLVSFIEDDKKGHFWIQRDPDKVDEMGEMLKRSQDHSMGGEGVKEGSAVVAEWGGTLYRGVVTGKSKTCLQVHFVDWGNSDFVDKCRVRLALETEVQEPSFAIR